MASASGRTPPVPFRVGATVACERTALQDNSGLEITAEDAGALTSCIEAGEQLRLRIAVKTQGRRSA